ncbi:unnamed protein product [Cuscuta campestris]|uniref:PWWP domain-containing protein n=1 Tax=Cuscuta campestris TaxID=132261 RepID=A0A484KFA7_9ASTE|nr:unnamed protein product [Cuscuta campestris]
MPKNEETSFKDEEAMDGHVSGAGVSSSLEKGEGLVEIPTLSEKVDRIGCFGHTTNENSNPISEPKCPPRHTVREDAVALLHTEKDAKFEGRDMHGDSDVDAELPSSEKDEGLVNPTVCEKVDIIDCSGHESNNVSDSPSEPNCSQSQIVREEETMFKDETMCDAGASSSEKDSHSERMCSQRQIVGEIAAVLVPREEETSFKDDALYDRVVDAGVSSPKKGEGLLHNPTVSVEIVKDCSGHESNNFSDSPSEPTIPHSQTVAEDAAASILTKEDSEMEDVDMHDSKSDISRSHCKDDTLTPREVDASSVNPPASEKVDVIDCYGHESNEVSDSPSEPNYSQSQIVREEETKFTVETCGAVSDAGAPSSEKDSRSERMCPRRQIVGEEAVVLVPRKEETSFKDEAFCDSVADAGISSSEKEDAADSIPREKDTNMEDVDMHYSKTEISQSRCKDETLTPREVDTSSVNPTAYEKVDEIDCSGHERNKVSDSLSEPNCSQSQIVGEDETRFTVKTMCDAVYDAGEGSSEKDSHSDQMHLQRQFVGKEAVVLVPREDETSFKHEALCDRVADTGVSSSEKEDAAALISTEEDTKMEDVDIYDSKSEISQSQCKDGTFMPREVQTSSVNPTVSKKVDAIDCLGHESNKVSESPSQGHSVAEDADALIPIDEETCLEEDMLDSVVDGDFSKHPRSHCEDVASMAREVETHFNNNEAICAYVADDVVVSSSEKGEGLSDNPIFSGNDDTIQLDCSGHASDRSFTKQTVGDYISSEEYTTIIDDKYLNDSVADARPYSLEGNEQGFADPTICKENNEDFTKHETDGDLSENSQSHCEDVASMTREVETSVIENEAICDHVADDVVVSSFAKGEGLLDNPIVSVKVDMIDCSGHASDRISPRQTVGDGIPSEEYTTNSDDKDLHDSVAVARPSSLEENEHNLVNPTIREETNEDCTEHGSGMISDCPADAVIGVGQVGVLNENEIKNSKVEANSRVVGDTILPYCQESLEGDEGNRTAIHDKAESLKSAGDHHTSSVNDTSLETSNYNDAMDIDDKKLDIRNATNLGSINDSDVVQNDEMDVDEETLDVVNDAANSGSTKDTDIVQTVVVPDNTQALENKIVANFALEGLNGHEHEPNDAVDLDTDKGTEVMGEQIVVNSAFEFVDEGFWQDDEGRNASMARSEDAPVNDQTGALKSLVEGVVTLKEDTTILANIETCQQQSIEATCKTNIEVDNEQNTEVTPISDQPIQTDVSHVAVLNEVDIEQAAEREKGPSKTNDGNFLDDVHGTETVFLDNEQEEEEEEEEEELELKQQKEIKEKEVKPVNIYPGFLHPPEKSGKFAVSDLVWGKVRSHPWWPGQIFDPADASEKAVRYYKKGCFLVAYFGDRTFAWNDSSVLKSFWSQFSQIEKQSTSETFQNAVRCALEEVSRRLQLGLSCSCTSKSSYSKIACQVVENTGIREESSRIEYSVDKCTAGVNSFSPVKLLQFLRGKACSPTSSCDQLDLVIARAQLLAHSCFKGWGVLSDFLQGGELENDDNAGPVTSNNKVTPSHKRKYHSSKERRMSEIIGSSSELDSKSEGVKSVYAAKVSPVTPSPPPFKIGERILRAASHLKGDCVQPETANGGHAQSPPSINELYSQLQLVARAPTGEYTFLDTFIRSILDLRKCSKQLSELVLQNPPPSGRPASVGGSKKRKGSQEAVDEGFEFDDDINDSYWTDMIVQNYSEDQQPLQHSVVDSSDNKSSRPNKKSRRSYSRKRYSIGNNSVPDVAVAAAVSAAADEDAEKRNRDPAELILKFGEGGGWLPSEMNLNKIFRRFGPIKELETEVHPECWRGRVVFKRGCDAEVAYSSAGKFNIFGSLPVNYEINYTPVISVRPMLLTIPQEQEQEQEAI